MKEQILVIAFKHFAKYGYAKTTLTGIAEELGKRKSALYYYYKNKEDIFEAIVRLEAENLLLELEVVFKMSASEEEIIRAYIKTRIAAMHMVSVRYRSLKEELFVLLPAIERVRSPYLENEIKLLHETIRRGVKSGAFDAKYPGHLAKVIAFTLKGLEIPMYVSEQLSYDPKEVQSLTELLINGLKNRVVCQEFVC